MKQDPSYSPLSATPNHAPTAGAENDPRQAVRITPLDFASLSPRDKSEHPSLRRLIGTSASMCALIAAILRASRHEYPVLIQGETGTGKSVIGQAIHECSARTKKRLVKINASCFLDGTAESQLFGHERGAFTGATERRVGSFEAAHGSTLFFDEIGDMPLALQAKLLTALDDKAYPRLGSNTPVQYDARIIYATNRDLERMVKEGTFRADLYRRINCLRIEVPPLAVRREDIPALVYHALCQHQLRALREAPYMIEPGAMELLCRRSWTGNIGELELFVQRLAVEVEERSHITVEDVRRSLRITDAEVLMLEGGRSDGAILFSAPPGDVAEPSSREELIHVPPYRVGEKPTVFIARTFLHIYNTMMERHGNSHGRVAQLMHIHRNNLYRRAATEQKHLGGSAHDAPRCLTDGSDDSGRRQPVAH